MPTKTLQKPSWWNGTDFPDQQDAEQCTDGLIQTLAQAGVAKSAIDAVLAQHAGNVLALNDALFALNPLAVQIAAHMESVAANRKPEPQQAAPNVETQPETPAPKVEPQQTAPKPMTATEKCLAAKR